MKYSIVILKYICLFLQPFCAVWTLLFYSHKVKKKRFFSADYQCIYTDIVESLRTKQTRNYRIIETDWLLQLTDRCTAVGCFPTPASDRTLALVDQWEKTPANWNRTCLLTVYDTSHDVPDVYCTHASRERKIATSTRSFVKRAKRQHCNVVTFWLHGKRQFLAATSCRARNGRVGEERETYKRKSKHNILGKLILSGKIRLLLLM